MATEEFSGQAALERKLAKALSISGNADAIEGLAIYLYFYCVLVLLPKTKLPVPPALSTLASHEVFNAALADGMCALGILDDSTVCAQSQSKLPFEYDYPPLTNSIPFIVATVLETDQAQHRKDKLFVFWSHILGQKTVEDVLNQSEQIADSICHEKGCDEHNKVDLVAESLAFLLKRHQQAVRSKILNAQLALAKLGPNALSSDMYYRLLGVFWISCTQNNFGFVSKDQGLPQAYKLLYESLQAIETVRRQELERRSKDFISAKESSERLDIAVRENAALRLQLEQQKQQSVQPPREPAIVKEEVPDLRVALEIEQARKQLAGFQAALRTTTEHILSIDTSIKISASSKRDLLTLNDWPEDYADFATIWLVADSIFDSSRKEQSQQLKDNVQKETQELLQQYRQVPMDRDTLISALKNKNYNQEDADFEYAYNLQQILTVVQWLAAQQKSLADQNQRLKAEYLALQSEIEQARYQFARASESLNLCQAEKDNCEEKTKELENRNVEIQPDLSSEIKLAASEEQISQLKEHLKIVVDALAQKTRALADANTEIQVIKNSPVDDQSMNTAALTLEHIQDTNATLLAENTRLRSEIDRKNKELAKAQIEISNQKRTAIRNLRVPKDRGSSIKGKPILNFASAATAPPRPQVEDSKFIASLNKMREDAQILRQLAKSIKN